MDEFLWRLLQELVKLKKRSTRTIVPIMTATLKDDLDTAAQYASATVGECADLFADVLYTLTLIHLREKKGPDACLCFSWNRSDGTATACQFPAAEKLYSRADSQNTATAPYWKWTSARHRSAAGYVSRLYRRPLRLCGISASARGVSKIYFFLWIESCRPTAMKRQESLKSDWMTKRSGSRRL